MNYFLFDLLNSLGGRSPIIDWIVVFFAEYALFVLWGAVFALLLFSLHARLRHRFHCHLQIAILAGLSALLARGIIAETLKKLLHNPRPFEVIANATQLIPHTTNGSFPSGHTVLAFSAAAAISFCYPRIAWLLYGSAIAIGISRVIAGVHWPLDIFGGAIIGAGSAYIIHYAFHHFTLREKNITHTAASSPTKPQTR